MGAEQFYRKAIDERRQQDRFRQLRNIAITGGAEIVDDQNRALLNFASNDYLGLSKHPKLKERAIEYIQKYGAGSGSSRLVSGNLAVYEAIERKVAEFKGTETALIFPSGYQTNATVIAALGRKETLMLSDHQNHNSMTFGMQQIQGKWQRYRHNDLTHLESRLQTAHGVIAPGNKPDELAESLSAAKTDLPTARIAPIWILSESVFSMDGDVSDVSALIKLATRFGASIYIDEAHATGIYGPEGRGTCFEAGSVDMVMGTFSKALGSFGAYIACTQIMRDFLINFCSGLIYSTALPPAVLGSIDAALDVVPTLDKERERLFSLSEYLRSNLQRLGFSTGNSTSQIIPIIIGEDSEALALAEHLEMHGILAPAIRPPTVPEGAARVRVSITADHTKQHIDQLVTCIAKFSHRCGVANSDHRPSFTDGLNISVGTANAAEKSESETVGAAHHG